MLESSPLKFRILVRRLAVLRCEQKAWDSGAIFKGPLKHTYNETQSTDMNGSNHDKPIMILSLWFEYIKQR